MKPFTTLFHYLDRERSKAYDRGFTTGVEHGKSLGALPQAFRITIDKTEHLIPKDRFLSKEQLLDMQHIVNSDEYATQRFYLLRQANEFHEKAASVPAERESFVLSQFARYLTELVRDFDRMRRAEGEVKPPQDPYAS